MVLRIYSIKQPPPEVQGAFERVFLVILHISSFCCLVEALQDSFSQKNPDLHVSEASLRITQKPPNLDKRMTVSNHPQCIEHLTSFGATIYDF